MKTKFEIDLHTVVIMVGPSQAGKSTWSSLFKKKVQEIDPALRCTILSTDQLRLELLGEDLHRYDRRMMNASEQAFDLLFAKLKAHMSFPVNNEFIVVDSTGLDTQFRIEVSQLARDHGYRVAVVAFDYPTGDYFKDIILKEHKEIISHHVENFKKRVLPSISRRSFDFSLTVREKSAKYFEELAVEISSYSEWKACQLASDQPVVFIGDIHEHVSALEELLRKLPRNVQIVLVGDYLDKGEQTRDTIELVEKLVAQGAKVVIGNHESFVARRLRGEVSAMDDELSLFSSLKVLAHDPQLAQRFLAIFDQSIPYVHYANEHTTAYATHAPCKNKYIGKHSEYAKKSQRNHYFKDRSSMSAMAKELSFIEEEAKRSHPWHIFGHVAHKLKKMESKNKLWLDTAAVYGGSLSAFMIEPSGKTRTYHVRTHALAGASTTLFYFPKDTATKEGAVEATEPRPVGGDELAGSPIAVVTGNSSPIDWQALCQKYNLEEKDVWWLQEFSQSQACFIAGTMAPAKSNAHELEPLSNALQYFQSKGVETVVLQPKFMGSRVQMYLFQDEEKSFIITRSGHKPVVNDQIKSLLSKYAQRSKELFGWTSHIILDGELMPWNAIGQELINREFIPYGQAFLKENAILASDPVFKSLGVLKSHDASWHHEHAKIFMEQLELYAKQGQMDFFVFNVLKKDEEVYPLTSHEVFTAFNPEQPSLVLKLGEAAAGIKAQEFFGRLTSDAYEGVVVKPLDDRQLNDCVPYMKVRNENYLHLIYGYDYQLDYAQMCANKRVGKKMALSLKQYLLSRQMLQAHHVEQRLHLACEMLFEIKQEEQLDSRL